MCIRDRTIHLQKPPRHVEKVNIVLYNLGVFQRLLKSGITLQHLLGAYAVFYAHSSGGGLPHGTAQLNPEAEPVTEHVLSSVVPAAEEHRAVSYTHLDVYKRQAA